MGKQKKYEPAEDRIPHPHENMSEREILDSANELARLIYKSLGYEVPKGYRFDEATHPQEQGMWNIATIAFDHITGTDLENVLANLEDE